MPGVPREGGQAQLLRRPRLSQLQGVLPPRSSEQVRDVTSNIVLSFLTKLPDFYCFSSGTNMKASCIWLFQVLRDILLHEGRVVRDQPDDQEELPVLPLQEVPRGGHENRLGTARRGAPQVCLNSIYVRL